jgi:hypothetical protein
MLDAMEEIGEHCGRRAGADQTLGLEGLNRGAAETFRLGVEQPAVSAADAIGLERRLRSLDWSSTVRPVMVRSSTGAVASEVSAVQRCSLTSGVMVTPSRVRMATSQSAAQARSGV